MSDGGEGERTRSAKGHSFTRIAFTYVFDGLSNKSLIMESHLLCSPYQVKFSFRGTSGPVKRRRIPRDSSNHCATYDRQSRCTEREIWKKMSDDW
ncbi:unnamed protein product [Onchocerca flexuosa]|uniref:Ovule protein n=1 Tax=Onchocerca flexuosa TaxID=387005 RepID=A0A183H0C0_9BILA|nr:unnamed protein product [Onchocerca flexuosa]